MLLVPKGLVRKQKELLKKKFGKCWLVPITAELRLMYPDMNEKTARNRADYYFVTGKNLYQVYGIVEKLLN
jgi:hypothetical protein